MTTKIEWTDETWNPLVGCAHVSPGCDNCYAAREAAGRLSGHPLYSGLAVRNPGEPAKFTGEIRMVPERMEQPLRWQRPRRIFVNSMSDLFHPDVELDFINDVWRTMLACPQHTFQILTKRSKRMMQLLSGESHHMRHPANPWVGFSRPLANVWLGTSIESDRYTFRADHLRATPAAVRFISAEPLLGPLPSLDLTGIDWLIAGGESGPHARPTDPDWVRDLRDRAVAAGVAFHFKQWGEWLPFEPDPQPPFWLGQDGDLIDGHHLPADISDGDLIGGWWWPDTESESIYHRVGKKTAGRELDGRTWDEYPT